MPFDSLIPSGDTAANGHRQLPANRSNATLVPHEHRLQPPDELGLGQGSRLPISEDIARLLHIDGRVFDLDAPDRDESAGRQAPFAALARERRADPAPVANLGLLPDGDLRYLKMSNFDLLQEVVQRSQGFGPEDIGPRENPDAPLGWRRLGDMTYALHFQPGREQDIAVLKNACWALDAFFDDYAAFLKRIRDARPDLQPALEAWSKEFVRSAVDEALRVPLGADGQAQFDPSLYGAVGRALQQPIEPILADLEQRMQEQSPAFYAAHLDRFFKRISAHREPGVAFDDGVLGAPANEVQGSEIRDLGRGKIVIRCSAERLPVYLQTLPPAQLQWHNFTHKLPDEVSRQVKWTFAGSSSVASVFNPRTAVAKYMRTIPIGPPSALPAAFATAVYPPRGGGTIQQIVWQDRHGHAVPLLVLPWKGVHSFCLHNGASWRPTGASALAWQGEARADAWRDFIVSRQKANAEATARGRGR